MENYAYPVEKRRGDSTNLLRKLFFEKAGWFVALIAGRLGLGPNSVSVISAAFGIVAIYINSNQYHLAGFLLMGFYYLFDNADGHLARKTGKASSFGAYLDDSIGLIIWPFYWGSFILNADGLVVQCAIITLCVTSEGRSLFGYKYSGLRPNVQHASNSSAESKASGRLILRILLQLTNVGGALFIVFPLLALISLEFALVAYGILFLMRYFLTAAGYGYRLWGR